MADDDGIARDRSDAVTERTAFGDSASRNSRPGTMEFRSRVYEMHAAGASDYAIAKALGYSRTAVRNAREVLKLTANYVRGWPEGCGVNGRRGGPVVAGCVALLLIAGSAQGHSFYTELQRPDGGGSCCSSTDCRPVQPCLTTNKRSGFMADGVCEEIPANKVLPVASPDGELHACYFTQWTFGGSPTHHILCIIQAGQS